jgi:hypothetical protein
MTSNNAQRDDSSFDLDDLFGKPALLKGEDRGAFNQLRAKVREVLQPGDFIAELEAQELAENIWEGRRLQTMATKLVAAERRKAIKFLTASRFEYVSEKSDDWFESLEGKYPDGLTEADVFKKMGLSVELVNARALLQTQEDVAVVERMAANRVATRKASLRDYERRKRLDAKRKRLTAKADLKQQSRAGQKGSTESHVKLGKKLRGDSKRDDRLDS